MHENSHLYPPNVCMQMPKQQLMATFYARLTQIFAVSENHLYHAYAWLKLFNFTRG